jgi:hypothetical protein
VAFGGGIGVDRLLKSFGRFLVPSGSMKNVAVTPMDEGLCYGFSVFSLAGFCVATRKGEEHNKNGKPCYRRTAHWFLPISGYHTT